MQWRQNMDEGKCKIRKRGNSSSSSSSMVRNYRLKRPILVGKRAGSTTPVPTWKMAGGGGGGISSAGGSPVGSLRDEKPVKNSQQRNVTARKLGATLWEMNEVASPYKKQSFEPEEEIKMNVERSRLVPSVVQRRNRHASVSSSSSSSHLYKDLGRLESAPHASAFIEVGSRTNTKGDRFGVGNRLKDVSDSLTTSKELLKVLNHVWSLETKHPAGRSILTALKSELQWVRGQVKRSIQEQGEIVNQFGEEMRAWKMKEQDRTLRAISSNAGELETERKLRKQAERMNKKLGKQIESEKRAREILEQVCEELSRGVGEEVEKEREMLQLADVLREERVQMKLSEAKYDYEEKNAAVDKLKSELEEYLGAKKGDNNINISRNDDRRIKELEDYLKKTLVGSCDRNVEKLADGVDSGDSQRQSIELTMDNNRNSFEWGYAYAIATQNDVGKSHRNNIFLESNMSDCIEWDLSNGFAQKNEDDEDEIKRYEMIKDLRDHIVSASSKGLRMVQEAV